MRRIAVLGGSGLLLVLMAAAVGFLQLRSHSDSATPSEACSPAPCADAGGYRVEVSDIAVQDGLVKVQVRFEVSGQTQHAQPEDFVLREGLAIRRPVRDPASGCPSWPRTNIAAGATFGPMPLCFHIATRASALVLNWRPDMGVSEYLSRGYDIKLT